MNEQGKGAVPLAPQTTARIVHAAMLTGLLITFFVFLYLAGRVVPDSARQAMGTIRIVGYAQLLVAAVATLVLRGRIRAPGSDDAVASWWTGILPTAVTVWALAEGSSLAALVLGWIVADTTLMALGAAVGLALLVVNRPGRLERV